MTIKTFIITNYGYLLFIIATLFANTVMIINEITDVIAGSICAMANAISFLIIFIMIINYKYDKRKKE